MIQITLNPQGSLLQEFFVNSGIPTNYLKSLNEKITVPVLEDSNGITKFKKRNLINSLLLNGFLKGLDQQKLMFFERNLLGDEVLEVELAKLVLGHPVGLLDRAHFLEEELDVGGEVVLLGDCEGH